MENTNKTYYCITGENVQDLIDYIKSNYYKNKKLYCTFYGNKDEENLSILLHGIKDYIAEYLSDALYSIIVATVPASDILMIDEPTHRGIEEIIHLIRQLTHELVTNKISAENVMIQFKSKCKNIVTVSINYELIDNVYRLHFYLFPVYTSNEDKSVSVDLDVVKYDQISTMNIENIVNYIKDNCKSDETDRIKKTIEMLHCVKDYIDKYLSLDITTIMVTSSPKGSVPNGLKIIEDDFDKAIDTIFEDSDNCISSSIHFKSENTFIVIIIIEDYIIKEKSKHMIAFDILPMDDFKKYVAIEIE